MKGFQQLSSKIENWIISHHYGNNNSTIFKQLYFFLNNIFYNKEQKEVILNNFCRIQNARYVLLRAIRRYKIKKYSVNTEDLLMTALSSHPEHSKIHVLENDKIYTFYLPVILNLWNKGLYESDYMIINPKSLKNPYTNKLLSQNTLNYIYVSACINMYKIPIGVREFVKAKYNKLLFIGNYGTILQEHAITNFVESLNIDLFKDILFINKTYPDITFNIETNITDFTKQEALIKDMKDILLMYYYLSYSTNYVKRESCRESFLFELALYNGKIPEEFRPAILGTHLSVPIFSSDDEEYDSDVDSLS